MTEKYGTRVRTCNLPIGDFMWEYNGQILDYVVERKKADDLMSSIFDGRYKEQKYRLKNSGFGNIYYLFEGHLTGNYAKNEREVSTALLNTRIKEKFRVVEVGNITESLKFIQFLTEQIANKMQTEGAVLGRGTLEEVAVVTGKASQLTVEHIFGLALRTVPGVGKYSIAEILKHFRSFRELYDQLISL
jgi:crossover junction endonuclease MUS81